MRKKELLAEIKDLSESLTAQKKEIDRLNGIIEALTNPPKTRTGTKLVITQRGIVELKDHNQAQYLAALINSNGSTFTYEGWDLGDVYNLNWEETATVED